MVNWTAFEDLEPALAGAGRKQLYQWEIGLAFLATVRPDGGPRVHPVCPVISPDGLHILVVPGPKQADLRRDPRFGLHSETCPPPRHDDGFYLTGHAREVTDADVCRRVNEQFAAERKQPMPWGENDALFELTIERCLLMLTEPDGTFPKGPTVWKAGHG